MYLTAFSSSPIRWFVTALLVALGETSQVQVQAHAVINEIHYAPDVKTEPVEFVELHNIGSSSLRLAGWRLAGGLAFTFPDSAQIPAGAFLVVAQDPDAVRQKFGVEALGPWIGRLSNQGDRVELRDAGGAQVDAVEYQLGFPWPTVGDPPGYSIELVHPALDNNLGGSWRASVQGNARPETRTLLPEGSSWRFAKGTTEASAPAAAWRATGFDDSSWFSGPMPAGYGEAFIRTPLDDMRSGYSSVFFRHWFEVDDPQLITTLLVEAQYDDGIKIWINGTAVINANLPSAEVPFDGTANSALENASFVPFPLHPAGLLRQGANLIAVQAHNSSLSASSDFFFDLKLTTQTGPAFRGPTPGARNSVFAENSPPQIRQVTHEPKQAHTGQPVVITAKVTDPDGVASVSLEYQVVEPGNYIELADAAYQENWVSVAMLDSASGVDLQPGDSVYSAQIPASVQVHRRLVRYRLVAVDGSGQAVTAPYSDDPTPNFAYFVYDEVPEWRGAVQPTSTDPERRAVYTFDTNVMRSLPVYHLISKKSSVERATWLERYGGDLYKWKGTLVYDGDVYDHIGFRARGGVWRYAMGKNMWKFDFNRGHDFEPRDNYGRKYDVSWTKLNLGACIQQADFLHRGEQGMFESAGLRLFNLAGVEAPQTHFVHFRIIDEAAESDPASQYQGDFWGLYLAVEQEDGRFLDAHGFPDGNLYKMESGTGELNNQGPSGATDKSDLHQFMAAYRNSATPDSWWRTHFDLDRYYSYQAIVQAIHHYDICYGKNYFYFLNPISGQWSVHPWDLDLTWADNMYDAGCGGTDEFKNRVLLRPAFRLEFQNRVRELRDLLFNEEQTWALLDELAALIDDPEAEGSFVDADRAMWDYHPVMADRSRVNASKAGQGRFYRIVPSKDFPGMVQKMKEYVLTRGAVLDALAEDPALPDQPVLAAPGLTSLPVNQLNFSVSPYSGSSPFAALRWRIGQVRAPTGTVPATRAPQPYEIEPVWESPALTEFASDITIPPEMLQVGSTYRVRARMQDNTGRWSHWSEPVEFTAALPEAAASLANHLRLTELMPNPTGGSDDEFVELHNTSSLLPLDLTAVRFTQGITFSFPAGTQIPPGGYLLVVRAPGTGGFAAFRSRYGLGPAVPIVGPYDGSLNNDGEQIALTAAAGGPEILQFEYGTGRGWPLPAEGAGHSLVPVERAVPTQGAGSLNYPGNWRASTFMHGSPGRVDPVTEPSVVLNEIVTHTDLFSEFDSNDWIELYNPTASPINLGANWFLSDDAQNLKKWQLPSRTTAPARGWLAFDEVNGFHPSPEVGFGLNKDGEQLFLSYLPGTTADRVVDSLRFKAQENDWSFGRYPDGGEFWSTLQPRSPVAANGAPPQQLVLNEIMFHPAATAAHPDDNTADEYVEIYNPTTTPISLFNTNGVYRLSGGIDLLFPPNTVLNPGQSILAVTFSPTNSAAVAAFRTAYNVPMGGVQFVGPYQGKLKNSSDRVALERPHAPDATNTLAAWVVVDEVVYADQMPFPVSADGSGLALHRISGIGAGNNPGNWRAAAPGPGRIDLANPDSDRDGIPDEWETAQGLDPNSPADATLDSDGDGLDNLREYQAGTNPRDPSSVLRLSAATERGGAVLSFTAAAGRAYTLWYRDSLTDGVWMLLQDFSASDIERHLELEDVLPPGITQRYYSLSAQPGG